MATDDKELYPEKVDLVEAMETLIPRHLQAVASLNEKAKAAFARGDKKGALKYIALLTNEMDSYVKLANALKAL